MFISKKKDQFLIALLGIIYGGIFFPFYTEFIEFGLVLSGKFEFSTLIYFIQVLATRQAFFTFYQKL